MTKEVTYLEPVKATPAQKHFVQLFIKYQGDYVKAFVESRPFGFKADHSTEVLKKKARNYRYSPKVIELLREIDFKSRLTVAKMVEEGEQTAIQQYGITKDRILAEMAKIAFANAADVAKWGPDGVDVKSSEDLTPDALGSVAEVSASGGGPESPTIVKIKQYDKMKALQMLGKEIGLFSEKVEHKGQVAVAAKFYIEGLG